MRAVRIVGAGLIGTSIALALSAEGVRVHIVDSNSRRATLAQDLIGTSEDERVDLVILALPTSQISVVIEKEFLLNPQAIFMDVGSVKTKPLDEIKTFPGVYPRFCGTHPMAGREIGGPEAARSDLFTGRPWIYTPGPNCGPDVIEGVLALINLLGAIPIRMSAEEHDSAVALVSHLPQISASLLADQLNLAPEQWLALAGQGLRDSTRIAASDPQLWGEIIDLNRERIRPLLIKMSNDLTDLIEKFDDLHKVETFIANGRLGQELIPGKHGGRPRNYTFLPIVIEDKPGQLASLFRECELAGVNIEDLSIEHSPGQFTGLVTLALSESDCEKLANHLGEKGWNVHSPR